MTLLTICQDAIEEIGGFQTPSTIIGNADNDAKLLLRCASRVGRELERVVARDHNKFKTEGGVRLPLPRRADPPSRLPCEVRAMSLADSGLGAGVK